MKTKLLTIAMTAALILAAITKGQAQQFDGPCLPSAHGLSGHQSAFCGSILTQTIALAPGTNWVSLNVDITLDDLKAALQNALGNVNATLKSKEANIRYTRGRWGATPSDFVWDVALMYMIEVGTNCEFTVEGTPIDPAEHSITIAGNGVATWIGFPLSGSMTLTDAFAGFATNGDAIKGKLGNNRYARNRWANSGLTTLEPGQGYIYTSAATGNRTFTFPTSAK